MAGDNVYEADIPLKNLPVRITDITLTAEKSDQIQAKSGDTKPAVILSTSSEYYAVAIIPSADLTTVSDVTIGDKTSEKVYKSIKIGDNEYTADKLGGNTGDYLFGVKVNVTKAGGGEFTLSELQNAITVSTTPYEAA